MGEGATIEESQKLAFRGGYQTLNSGHQFAIRAHRRWAQVLWRLFYHFYVVIPSTFPIKAFLDLPGVEQCSFGHSRDRC